MCLNFYNFTFPPRLPISHVEFKFIYVTNNESLLRNVKDPRSVNVHEKEGKPCREERDGDGCWMGQRFLKKESSLDRTRMVSLH